MKKIYDLEAEENKKTRAFLVGLPLLQNPGGLAELDGLIWTLGMENAGQMLLQRLDVQPAYGMGSGKAKEICQAAQEAEADCIIMDWDPGNTSRISSPPVASIAALSEARI